MTNRFLAEPITVINAAVRHDQVSINSGGPPMLGAVLQSDGANNFVWSATIGLFLLDEDGNYLTDQDGNYLVG